MGTRPHTNEPKLQQPQQGCNKGPGSQAAVLPTSTATHATTHSSASHFQTGAHAQTTTPANNEHGAPPPQGGLQSSGPASTVEGGGGGAEGPGARVAAQPAPPPLTLQPSLLPRCAELEGCAALHGLRNVRELRLWAVHRLPTPGQLLELRGLSHLQLLDLRVMEVQYATHTTTVTVTTTSVASTPPGPVPAPGLHAPSHSCSAITDDHASALSHLTGLTGLHLNCVTEVTGAGLAHLARLTGLVSLGLSDALDARLVSAAHLKVRVRA